MNVKSSRELIILGDAIGSNRYQYDRVALDIASMRILHIRISSHGLISDDPVLSMLYPICVEAELESSYRDIWLANRICLNSSIDDGTIVKIMSIKASYPYRFLDGFFHMQYGLGKLQSFNELYWHDKRLWMKGSIIAGTDEPRTVLLYGDRWKDMLENSNRISLENRLMDWSNDVFCLLIRPNVERTTYCYGNILIFEKESRRWTHLGCQMKYKLAI